MPISEISDYKKGGILRLAQVRLHLLSLQLALKGDILIYHGMVMPDHK